MRLQLSDYLSQLTSNEVYFLGCSDLETGTHKDLRSKYVVDYAVRNGINQIHLITTGNAGIGLKRAIEKSGSRIHLINIVPTDLEEKIVKSLTGLSSRVVKLDLGQKFLSAGMVEGLVSSNSYDATYIEGNQYDEMIKRVISVAPNFVALPIGSGELYNCFYNYIRESRLSVKLIGVVPQGNHPLSSKKTDERTLADKLYCKFMNPNAIKKTQEALSEGHKIVEIDNKQIEYCMRLSENLGLNLEPSGAVSLVIPQQLKNKKIACVLTGKGTPPA